MATPDIPAEELANLFQHYQKALAREFGCNSQDELIRHWEETPHNERKVMLAAAKLKTRADSPIDAQDRRKYYATHGEAEWGC